MPNCNLQLLDAKKKILAGFSPAKSQFHVAQSRLAAEVVKILKARSYDRSEARSGLTSILAFALVQGMELSNPLVQNDFTHMKISNNVTSDQSKAHANLPVK
ncbi:hypothetical protein GUJ93_ZPchr0006g43256 [Zizania palustris]|uniref:Uncharacterized protein n=1 Tax=Zizania palustris TaxID=103762 RepID=A0A8J5SCD0_ZIZPA|nr:hypothetical protein GUJ93_ZPchr0006g43256 [Zizania palustris]